MISKWEKRLRKIPEHSDLSSCHVQEEITLIITSSKFLSACLILV